MFERFTMRGVSPNVVAQVAGSILFIEFGRISRSTDKFRRPHLGRNVLTVPFLEQSPYVSRATTLAAIIDAIDPHKQKRVRNHLAV
jgi:hypothetical protein